MSPLDLILLLVVVGFLLVATEMFVPGLILGSLGGLCLAGAVGVSYYDFGVTRGTVALLAIGAFSLVGFMIWMAVFPRTNLGRKIVLQQTLVQGEGEKTSSGHAAGLEGTALTPLRPAGTASIEGRRVDVVAEGEFIERGEAVVVLRDEGSRVVVRKSARANVPVA